MPDSDNFSLSGLLEELEAEIDDREKSSEPKKEKASQDVPKRLDEAMAGVLPVEAKADSQGSLPGDDWQLMGLLKGLEGQDGQEKGAEGRSMMSMSQFRGGGKDLKPGVERPAAAAIQVPRPWPSGEAVVAFTSLASDENAGYRNYMEDGSVAIQPFEIESLSGDKWAFFAVYDGHGGREAVDYCEMRLHQQVALEMKSLSPAEALKTSFLKIDSQLGMYGAWNHGTTATLVLVQRSKTARTLHVAHVGDSRAVLIENIGCPRSLTKDHRPSDPDEAKQVLAAGGIVSGGRVGGDLAISRSLGDHRLKGKGLSCTPDVCTASVAAGHILIVATDGLWDVLSDEAACKLVEKSVEQATDSHKSPADVSEYLGNRVSQALVDEAKRLGSRDNILVLTLFF